MAPTINLEMTENDAQVWQEEHELMETIAGIELGLASMKAGKGRPAKEVFEELRQEFGFPERTL